MPTLNRLLAVVMTLVLLLAGCATGVDSSRPVPDIAGSWVGYLSITTHSLLTEGGAMSGPIRVTIEQQNRGVRATIVATGLQGNLQAYLYGNEFSGRATGVTPQGDDSVSVEGKLIGDRIDGTIDGNPFTLRRVEMVVRSSRGSLEDEFQRLDDLKSERKITEEEYAWLRKRVIEGVVAKPRDVVQGLIGTWRGTSGGRAVIGNRYLCCRPTHDNPYL